MAKKTAKIIGFVTGWILIFLGGLTFLITTIPGIALLIWSITGRNNVIDFVPTIIKRI